MSVAIPTDFSMDVGLDDVNLDISGIPTSFTMNANIAPMAMSLALGPIELKPIELRPIDFSLRLKEIPAIRVHLPLDYRVGLSLLGSEVLCIHLCGQGQVITEPYAANPCEGRAANLPQQPGLAELDKLVRSNG